jgi:DNA-binding transcriptional ArsR family regulator
MKRAETARRGLRATETTFHAISSPTRRKLLDVLVRGERSVGELVETMDVTQGAVSQQLAVLERAGLVTQRAEGRFRFYSLRAEPLALVEQWLRGYREFVEGRLDVLGVVLDEMEKEK